MLARQPGLLACIVLILAVLVVFCIFPVIRLFVATLTNEAGRLDLSNIRHIMDRAVTENGHCLVAGIHHRHLRFLSSNAAKGSPFVT